MSQNTEIIRKDLRVYIKRRYQNAIVFNASWINNFFLSTPSRPSFIRALAWNLSRETRRMFGYKQFKKFMLKLFLYHSSCCHSLFSAGFLEAQNYDKFIFGIIHGRKALKSF